MTRGQLADCVFWFHAAWALLLVSSGFINMDLWRLVVPGTLVCQVLFMGCPLTTVEASLRGKSAGSFTVALLGKAGIVLSAEWLAILTAAFWLAATVPALLWSRR